MVETRDERRGRVGAAAPVARDAALRYTKTAVWRLPPVEAHVKSTGRARAAGYPALSLVPVVSTPAARMRSEEGLRAADGARAIEDALALAPPADAGVPARRIVIDADGKLEFVAVADIQCVEARGDLIVVHTARGSHLLRATLQAMHARLGGERFLRIHRSILVSCEAIARMERTPRGDFVLTLANGQRYASSASHRQSLLEYIRRCRP
jgi:DNA-binding LytR/AlgR family response regulator